MKRVAVDSGGRLRRTDTSITSSTRSVEIIETRDDNRSDMRTRTHSPTGCSLAMRPLNTRVSAFELTYIYIYIHKIY